MEFAKKYQNELITGYVKQGKSSYQLAEELGTNPSKILKALKYLGVERRDKSQAQANALKKERTGHPTKGKKMSEESKFKIGQARAKIWSEMSEKERSRMAALSKEKWNNMTASEKEEMQKLAAEAVRTASKEGSKMERYLRDFLRDHNYETMFHVKNLIPAEKLEIDLYVPRIRTVVEIDGPAHFLPIWGEEKLAKHQRADAVKSGLLLNGGFKLLRVKQIDKTLSKQKMNTVSNVILTLLKSIEDGTIKENLIEIEVKDGKVHNTYY